MSSTLTSIAAASQSPITAQTTSSVAQQAVASGPLANESTFLTLLVSQLQNQDPLNPTDSNQFVSQLTAYSQLEQLIAINQNTAPASTQTATPATSVTAPTATQSGSNSIATSAISK